MIEAPGAGGDRDAGRPSCSSTRCTASARPSRTRCSARGGTGGPAGRRHHREPVLLGRVAAAVALAGAPAAAARPRDVRALLRRALADERGLDGGLTVDDDASAHLVRLAGGRRPAGAHRAGGGRRRRRGRRRPAIDLAAVEQAVDRAAVRYDRDGDQHYDVISAFIKSIRGSDVGRRAALPRPHDRGGGGPAVHRPAAGGARVRGRRDGRSHRAAGRDGRRTGRRSSSGMPEAGSTWRRPPSTSRRRRSRTPSSPRSTPRWPTCAAGAAGAVPAHLRDGHYAGAQKLGNAVRATATRTTTPTASCRSSTRRTSWSAATTTSRPRAAPNARSPTGWNACAGSSVARPGGRERIK